MKLDTKATIEGITEVLEHYKTLKKIAGDNYVSKITATFSFEPRCYTGTVRNPIEEHIVSFVTIQINTALKPRRRFRNRAARLSQTTDLNDFLYFYKFLVIIKSSSRIYCG